MAFPLAPTNGQQFTEAANDRKWVYDGVRAAWVPADRADLDDFDDVDITTVLPTDLQPLVFDGALWTPDPVPTAGAFVPLIEDTVDPVDGMANLAPAGTIWRNTTTQRSWVSTQLADFFGVTSHQEAQATNPAGVASYSGETVWGVNFVSAYDTTINSIGMFFNSWAAGGSTVTAQFFEGANGATFLSGSTPDVVATFPGANFWRDCTLDEEITLVAGQTYSASFTVTGTHVIGHLDTDTLYLSQWDADSDGDTVTVTMIASGHVMAPRVGYDHGASGTVWWPIDAYTGDGLATIERLAAPPAAPVDGQVYYNTAISALFVYDAENTNWIQCLN